METNKQDRAYFKIFFSVLLAFDWRLNFSFYGYFVFCFVFLIHEFVHAERNQTIGVSIGLWSGGSGGYKRPKVVSGALS